MNYNESLTNYAIITEKLCKHYRVYINPVDRLKETLFRRPFHQLVHSLIDVSIQIARHEAVGIIGENGSGKSTLLKILAGTTQASSGTLIRRGKVAALLELGSGFNPEFSGRANIQLNAALLGLTEKEIRNKEKAIIEFSELGEVIDRPVKTYSSGMYVRLAFSIATSVDPDILIVDEALSVGDQRFAQKCIERIMQFRKEGKTIIFCSHSMYLVNQLCDRTIWLNRGRIAGYGISSKIISEYLSFLEKKNGKNDCTSESAFADYTNKESKVEALLDDVAILDSNGKPSSMFYFQNDICVRIRVKIPDPPYLGHIGVMIINTKEEMVFFATTKHSGYDPICFKASSTIQLIFKYINIMNGTYFLKVVIGDRHGLRIVSEHPGIEFCVESKNPELGMFYLDHEWIIDN